MARHGPLIFKAGAPRRAEEVLALAEQWSKRADKLKAALPYYGALYVKRELLQRVPKKAEWKSYRQSLEVARIAGLSPGEFAFAVRTNMKHRAVRKMDAQRTVLYVRVRKQLRKVAPEVFVLEKYGPWTMDTIPFTPERSDAYVISRKQTKLAVDKVAKARRKDRSKWRAELDRAGFREVKKDTRIKVPKKLRAIPEMALDVLKLEFGLGGAKPKAHWRPAIRRLILTGVKEILRTKHELKRSMTSLSARQWKRWPPKTRHKIGISQARSFIPFQKKLGIRMSR